MCKTCAYNNYIKNGYGHIFQADRCKCDCGKCEPTELNYRRSFLIYGSDNTCKFCWSKLLKDTSIDLFEVMDILIDDLCLI